ncbi:MAG: PDZ domain-containing protein [Gemmataceae bacterium]|nr:PDZ domain-containing protein [Gemmataceae bacterium]
MRRFLLATLMLLLPATIRAQDLNDELEKMTKEAMRKVGPSVVQIVTQGGIDMVVTSAKGAVFRKALGPTTGVVVSTDGFIISSAFNFINNPTAILVAVPGHKEPYVARKIATDRSRLLTLLKIDANNLPVPGYVPKKEIVEGQWSIALGRTLDAKREQPPAVSVGVISALNRIWSKAIQTDAKISPINYGGPIVDIVGRVQGILVPASPKGDDETAGFEWYDSGIGFAIPMEDVQSVLPRLKEGKDLKKGLLGIRMKTGDIYGAVPEIGEVLKDTAAARAGLKPGDVVLEIDGKPVARMAEIQHLLGPKYEGDKIALKYKRDDKTFDVNNLELVGQLTVLAHPFLGILPMRDDPKLGVDVRYVFAKSPAEKAGLKAGDRIVKFGLAKTDQDFTGQVPGRQQFTTWLNGQGPGTEIKLDVKRKDGKTETLTATLDAMPGSTVGQDYAVPDKLPEEASHKKARAPLETNNKNIKPAKVDPPADKAETGLVKRNTPDGEHKFYLWVPENYDPDIAHGLVVWLHPPGKNKEADFDSFADLWLDFCEENRLIILGPVSDSETWLAGESDMVVAAIHDTLKRYTIDRQRVVAHGLGVGGQMALYLGFNDRDLIRGVATTGAVVTALKDNLLGQRLAFYLAAGDLDPLVKGIAESRTQLQSKRFSVLYREVKNRGREYLDAEQLRELARWIDTLDKQ